MSKGQFSYMRRADANRKRSDVSIYIEALFLLFLFKNLCKGELYHKRKFAPQTCDIKTVSWHSKLAVSFKFEFGQLYDVFECI